MEQDLRIEVERLTRLDGEGPTKAFADISVAGTLLIKGLRIVQGKNGVFVSMPRKPGKDGRWYNTIELLDDQAKEGLARLILSAYGE